jgi:transcriptional regulator with XRE-family HTH domain
MQKKKPGPPKGRKQSEIERSAFGERLFKTRRARGISQTELGKRVGISRRMVCHYEGNAPEGPPLTTLNKIAEALNVTVSYLLGESTQKAIKDDVKPILQKHFRIIQEMPTKEQKKVLEYVEMLKKKIDEKKDDGTEEK